MGQFRRAFLESIILGAILGILVHYLLTLIQLYNGVWLIVYENNRMIALGEIIYVISCIIYIVAKIIIKLKRAGEKL